MKQKLFGGAQSTKNLPKCHTSNLTTQELYCNNRYIYGKNTASGWMYKKVRENLRKKTYQKLDELIRNYYKNKFSFND